MIQGKFLAYVSSAIETRFDSEKGATGCPWRPNPLYQHKRPGHIQIGRLKHYMYLTKFRTGISLVMRASLPGRNPESPKHSTAIGKDTSKKRHLKLTGRY